GFVESFGSGVGGFGVARGLRDSVGGVGVVVAMTGTEGVEVEGIISVVGGGGRAGCGGSGFRSEAVRSTSAVLFGLRSASLVYVVSWFGTLTRRHLDGVMITSAYSPLRGWFTVALRVSGSESSTASGLKTSPGCCVPDILCE